MYNKFVVKDCFPLDIMKEWQENEEPGSLFIQEQERIYMKKELEYFYIENSFGGNQDWFRDYWMHMGGCAAAAACDSCISMEKAGVKKKLYPFDINNLNKSDYLDFSMLMKPYLRPRLKGIDRLDIYVDGMGRYLRDIGNTDLQLGAYSDSNPVQEAMQVVKNQIDSRFPIPYLLLRHKNNKFKDLLWHWFMLTGYEEFEGELYVKETTYGGYRYLSFQELWNSGYRENGGMILYS